VLAESPVPARRRSFVRRPAAALMSGVVFAAGVAAAGWMLADADPAGAPATGQPVPASAAAAGNRGAMVMPAGQRMTHQIQPGTTDR
jgi:hypothetical protein